MLYRRASRMALGTLVLAVFACSGGDLAGPADPPDPDPAPLPGPAPAPDPGPAPDPVPAPDPGPVPAPDPGPAPDPDPAPDPGPTVDITGTYGLVAIDNAVPGQMVALANPDGILIGIYRFDAVTRMTLDPQGTFQLDLRYRDDKGEYQLPDEGGFTEAGNAPGVVALTFTSAVYGDAFSGVAGDRYLVIEYDFDGDGQPDTALGFEKLGG
jgi:hypothetical protein